MPHYYLDVRYSQMLLVDETGRDFIDLAEAISAAKALLAEAGEDLLSSCSDGPQVEISDDDGPVASVPMVFAVTSPVVKDHHP